MKNSSHWFVTLLKRHGRHRVLHRPPVWWKLTISCTGAQSERPSAEYQCTRMSLPQAGPGGKAAANMCHEPSSILIMKPVSNPPDMFGVIPGRGRLVHKRVYGTVESTSTLNPAEQQEKHSAQLLARSCQSGKRKSPIIFVILSWSGRSYIAEIQKCILQASSRHQ